MTVFGQFIVTSFMALALIGLPRTVEAQPMDFEQVRDQGVLYFKRGLFKQAKGQLSRALKDPRGQADFVTLFYLASTSFELLLLEDAFKYSDLAARSVGPNKRHQSRLKEFVTELRSLYGAVLITAQDATKKRSGRIDFKATTGMINKQKRQRFEAIQHRFSTANARLPTKVYLPYGSYVANETPFTIEEGVPAPTIKVSLRYVKEVQREADDGFPILGVSLGAAAATALGVGAVLLLGSDDPEPSLNRHPIRFREEPVAP